MVHCCLPSETVICFATKHLLTDVVQQPRAGFLCWAPDVVTGDPRRVCWAQVAQNAWHAVPPSLRNFPFSPLVYRCPIAFCLEIFSSYHDPIRQRLLPEDRHQQAVSHPGLDASRDMAENNVRKRRGSQPRQNSDSVLVSPKHKHSESDDEKDENLRKEFAHVVEEIKAKSKKVCVQMLLFYIFCSVLSMRCLLALLAMLSSLLPTGDPLHIDEKAVSLPTWYHL